MTRDGTPLHRAHVSLKIGSRLQILTADHPHHPALRRQGYDSGIPIRIGENV
jgi:maltose O-acetyltransferase